MEAVDALAPRVEVLSLKFNMMGCGLGGGGEGRWGCGGVAIWGNVKAVKELLGGVRSEWWVVVAGRCTMLMLL